MFLFLIFAVIGMVLLYWGIKYKGTGYSAKENTIGVRAIVIAWWLVLFIILGCVRLYNGIEIKKLYVFATIDQPNIQRVIDRTIDFLNETNSTEWGLEKIALYQTASDRNAELVTRIFDYNQQLVGYRIYHDNLWTSWFIPYLKDLQFIKLEE